MTAFPEVEIKFLSTFFGMTKTDKVKLSIPENTDIDSMLTIIEPEVGHETIEHIRSHLDYIVIAVNNIDYRQLQGLKTVIKEGDKLVIGHVIAGG